MGLLDIVPKGRKQDPATLLNILTYELGWVAHGVHYASIREGKESKAYLAEARINLADLLTTSRQLAEKLGWDWDQLVADGEERFREKMEDARRELASKRS